MKIVLANTGLNLARTARRLSRRDAHDAQGVFVCYLRNVEFIHVLVIFCQVRFFLLVFLMLIKLDNFIIFQPPPAARRH